jgi:hypothetical protein
MLVGINPDAARMLLRKAFLGMAGSAAGDATWLLSVSLYKDVVGVFGLCMLCLKVCVVTQERGVGWHQA